MNASPQIPRSRNPRPTTAAYGNQHAQEAVQRLRSPRVLIQVPDLNAPASTIAIPTNLSPSVTLARHVTPTRAAATLGVLVVITVGMVLMGRGDNDEAKPEAKPAFSDKTPSLWVGTPNDGTATGKFASEMPTASAPAISQSAGVHLQAKGGMEKGSSASPFDYRSSFSGATSQAPELVGPQLNHSSQLPGSASSTSGFASGGYSQQGSTGQYPPLSQDSVPSMATSHPGAAMFARDAGPTAGGYDHRTPSSMGENTSNQYGPTAAAGWTEPSGYRTANRTDYPPTSGYQAPTTNDSYSAGSNYPTGNYASGYSNSSGTNQNGYQSGNYPSGGYETKLPAEPGVARFQGNILK